MVCVLAANPILSVVCGTVMAQLLLGPVGVLLVQDHNNPHRSTETQKHRNLGLIKHISVSVFRWFRGCFLELMDRD
jgi:hypothetical protein